MVGCKGCIIVRNSRVALRAHRAGMVNSRVDSLPSANRRPDHGLAGGPQSSERSFHELVG
ncbi:hypothetical protein CBM2589_B200091 [Cupriavidus taiwanensis]|uniref:Uncharacterized protein n=1 Tax=Cupriavidus taiwanensis TaxID=164546 RepID=A0A375BM99_9BURK|nr:hypothetical protein CBM2589_B200091 [Cupriavidus taiwanensis]